MDRYGTVIFDCDSTLSAIEGIEELAGAHRVAVVELTEAAMRGEVPLEEVYGLRLELVRPSREQVEALGRLYVETLVEDARVVVDTLRTEGVDVRLLSGGLLPAILVLARELDIPEHRVAAVDVRFAADGSYAGYDADSPLARSGGKREVLDAWAPALARPLMLVGDGATDLEAKSRVELFVAFAGVVERPAVAAGADLVLRGPSLAPVLPLALGRDRPPIADPAGRACYQRGLRLLAAVAPARRRLAEN